MLGICIVGGGLFFSFWDFWMSLPPGNQMHKQSAAPAQAAATGKEIDVELNFMESPDFTKLAFNALPGEPGHNPDVQANVGDKIEFAVKNMGMSFHAFGVTAATEGFEGVIPGTEINSASNPLKPGQSGKSEFVPAKERSEEHTSELQSH